MQLAQLLFFYAGWCTGEQILTALRLRKGDHIANLIHARHHRHQAIKAKRQATVGRRAAL